MRQTPMGLSVANSCCKPTLLRSVDWLAHGFRATDNAHGIFLDVFPRWPMSVPIRCPNCAKTGKVPSTYVGLPVRCPVCHSRFRVPELGKTTDYPIAEPFPPPPATA